MKAKILITILVGLLVLLAVAPTIPAGDKAAEQAQSARQKDAKTPPELERVTFVNIPRWSSPPWYPWYPPEQETDTYRLVMGGIRWPGDNPLVDCVIYTSGAPAGTFAAVEDAFQVWDEATPAGIYGDIDEQGGDPPDPVRDGANTVSWGPIDGPGGAVAVTSFWYWPQTKELVEFDMVFDSAESWSTPEASGVFDVRNVMTHELGH
ncbi:MAG: matrixin family metalloprotease, partial [Planctomycetota bacterium]